MKPILSRRLLLLAGVLAASALMATAILDSGSAGASRAAARTTITVTAGKPAEFAFTLSRRSLPAGTVVFKVTNRGKLTHDFELCLLPTAHATADSCKGKVTRKLAPGQSTMLVVSIPKTGHYEYLCTIPGHAAGGMKGLLAVTAAPAAQGGSSGALIGAGKTLFHSNCGTCHTLKAAGTHGTTGPDLDTINPTLGKIVTQITSGGRFMPPFGAANGGNLSTTQIKQIAAFVYASEH